MIVPLGVWHSEPAAQGFFLVCCLLSQKSFHPEAFRITLLTSFNLVKGLEFKMIDEGRFLLKFHYILDS